eukprot:scaffold3644_cov107-Isochrysis_galbana.AAC.8
MTALLIHDLREPMHAGHPDMPLVNPQQIFSQGSFHGGAWRCAFTFDSIGAPSVLLYYVLHFLVKYYLAAYNAVQTAGWGYVLFKAIAHYFLGGVAGAPSSLAHSSTHSTPIPCSPTPACNLPCSFPACPNVRGLPLPSALCTLGRAHSTDAATQDASAPVRHFPLSPPPVNQARPPRGTHSASPSFSSRTWPASKSPTPPPAWSAPDSPPRCCRCGRRTACSVGAMAANRRRGRRPAHRVRCLVSRGGLGLGDDPGLACGPISPLPHSPPALLLCASPLAISSRCTTPSAPSRRSFRASPSCTSWPTRPPSKTRGRSNPPSSRGPSLKCVPPPHAAEKRPSN